MNAIVNFDFEGKGVRTVTIDNEPWFVGLDVCRILEIKDHTQALDRLSDDERGGCTVPTPRGEQQVIVISEPGVYRLVFASRKPAAERFKRWLAHEVLPALRKTGSYVMPAARRPLRPRFKGDLHPAEVSAWSSAARVYHAVYGKKAAQELIERSPLPPPSAALALSAGRWSADDTLAFLLDLAAGDALTLGELVRAALNDKAKRRDLEEYGVLLLDLDAGPAMIVADDHPFLRQGFEDTEICYAWKDRLRLLPGAHRAAKPMQIDGKLRRGVVVPMITHSPPE
ncbi:hypothetical protein FHS55_002118 [Angulomicrobium tetraedrale]|uniref:Bro-N domain-containing protein n=1 Tax=Ancylobacter tetraedralis TaxID=217068 RepID=A0A839Z9W0_9HYPH|nr:BRO family protein [Ancylobacter tetraedralis]MBB3771519.1 hypothetical protein [Ancylobacter tetraedralis]